MIIVEGFPETWSPMSLIGDFLFSIKFKVMNTYIMGIDPGKLDSNWTAVVKLKNGVIETIWHTAWPSSKDSIQEVKAISSDYPRRAKNNESGH
jgi:hypothetical protein